MSTPKRGKNVAVQSTNRSPRNLRWTQPYEDTLHELLVRETRKGNRPDSSFTSIAFRNIVADFNGIHGTTILKKHVHSRIKTIKSHFVAFHGTFNGLSGFSWNEQTKMFDAEDWLWAQRIQENSKMEKFRDKACHNWDKLFELYGDTRAIGAEACGIKERSKRLQREIDFDDVGVYTKNFNISSCAGGGSSSYADHDFSQFDAMSTNTPDISSMRKSRGLIQSKKNIKTSMQSVMEDGYKNMAASIDKLSMALAAGNKFDVDQNSQIFDALSGLGLEEKFKVKCMFHLNANPSQAALLVAAPNELRGTLLEEIMATHRDAP